MQKSNVYRIFSSFALVIFVSIISDANDSKNLVYQASENKILDLNCYKEKGTEVCSIVMIKFTLFGQLLSFLYGDDYKYGNFKKEMSNRMEVLKELNLDRMKSPSASNMTKLIESVESYLNSNSEQEFLERKSKLKEAATGFCIFNAFPIEAKLTGKSRTLMKSKLVKDKDGCNSHYELNDDKLTYFSSGQKCKKPEEKTATTIVNFENKKCERITYVGN